MTKILLVEDDKSLREIYGVRLLAEGYDIVSAGDGEEALAMAIKEKPGLIVSDVMMPKISGFDMLDILRSTTETRDIKVIMMTALSSDDQRARGEQLGADRYLVKSQVGIEDVVRTVHDVLGDGGAAAAPASEPVAQAQPVSPQPSDDQPSGDTAQPAAPAQDPAAQSVADLSVPDSAPAETLPQPTAPFSSPRPATLGERVINPIEPPAPAAGESVASQIEQELSASTEPVAPTQADTTPTQFEMPPFEQSTPPQAPSAPTPITVQDQPMPAAPVTQPQEEDTDLRPAQPTAPQPPVTPPQS